MKIQSLNALRDTSMVQNRQRYPRDENRGVGGLSTY